MSKKITVFSVLLYFLALVFIANSFIFVRANTELLFAIIPIFIFTVVFAGIFTLKTKSKRLKTCYHGAILLTSFLPSVYASVIYHIILAFKTIPNDYMTLVYSAVFSFVVHFVVFWVGIICVYLTSYQLGIKKRVLGALFGFVPIVDIIMLFTILKTVYSEFDFEINKENINNERAWKHLCKTKYPLLLVHGVFFRDNKYLNYWGRIPKELERNGATVYYGNHQSAASIENSAKELSRRIKEIVNETGCQKVNIIAHSKGGLDCRYAIANCDIAPYVASLTTVNTPHRGCLFADFLLEKISQDIKDKVANTYNKTLKKLGDSNPDFMAAVNDLTASHCQKLDKELICPDGIYTQSIGSIIKKATSGKFPLNFSYYLVKLFDGNNDGLVSEQSFEWGEDYTLLSTKEKRGISHADIIDLSRENLSGFDVREFYVELVNKLKNKGI